MFRIQPQLSQVVILDGSDQLRAELHVGDGADDEGGFLGEHLHDAVLVVRHGDWLHAAVCCYDGAMTASAALHCTGTAWDHWGWGGIASPSHSYLPCARGRALAGNSEQ